MITEEWDGIFGHDKVKNCLTNLIHSSQIPHAFLFHGPNGVGKHFTAIRFTQLINKINLSYEVDNVYTKICKLSEPFIKFIIPLPRGKNELPSDSPIEKLNKDILENIKNELNNKILNPYYKISIPNANNIKINSIREIKNFLTFNFDDIKYRVILIENADLMSDESQNALLKSLEEPPQNFIFILTTSKPELLFHTIKSRCWNIQFDPLSKEDVSKILTGYFTIESNQAEVLAFFSSGSIYNAIELLNHNLESLIEYTLNILRYTLTNKIYSSIAEINKFIKENSQESIKLLIKMLILWLDDIQKERNGFSELYYQMKKENIIKFNKSFPKAKIDVVISTLNNILGALENNINLNIATLNLIFELNAIQN